MFGPVNRLAAELGGDLGPPPGTVWARSEWSPAHTAPPGTAQRPDIPIIMGQHFLKHTSREKRCDYRFLDSQTIPWPICVVAMSPTMVRYRGAEQANSPRCGATIRQPPTLG